MHISMYNKGRGGESTYFSTKMSGFIRVSCSRKARGNKTWGNTNRDSHYQPLKYADHTLIVYIERREMCIFTHFHESTFSSTKAPHQSFSGQTTPQTSNASKLTLGIMNFRCCVLVFHREHFEWATNSINSTAKGAGSQEFTEYNRTQVSTEVLLNHEKPNSAIYDPLMPK